MFIYNAIMDFTSFMWSWPILVLLIGGGLFLTVMCDFVQIKHFGYMLKKTFGEMFVKKEGKTDSISGVQAMIATLANTIGTGNIVGVGSAIAIGGPGAVFWMWVIGFVAMVLKYSEAVLGVATRSKDASGNWKGGAQVYLARVWKPLGPIWSAAVLFCFPLACGVHTGSITSAMATYNVPVVPVAIVFAVITLFVILGGMNALVSVTDRLVPIMTVCYILFGILIIVLNIGNLIPAVVSIFANAFTGTAATGGFAGSALAQTIKIGCARGVYSNDGGNGTASILHSQADVEEPVEQGMYGIFEVFFCTMVVCTFTAMVVLVTGRWTSGDPGSVLAINSFGSIGPVGHFICAFSLIMFAASSALSMATSSGILAKEMFGSIVAKVIQVLVLLFIVIGGTIGVDAALPWVDVANMITIVFNVAGTLFLSGMLRELTLKYFENH